MLKSSTREAEIVDFESQNKCVYYRSDFAWLMATNGIRPEMLIGLMGTTGSGKSTLMKSVIAEVAQKEITLVWLSEETVKEYQAGIRRAAILMGMNYKTVMSNLRFIEEKNLDEFFVNNQADLFEMFKDMVVESGSKVVFIDNLSTSNFYTDEIGVKGQGVSALFFSKITKRLNISIFYAIHTSKNIYDNMDRLITKEDVRGNQKIVILSEYFYVIQKFTVDEKVYPILRIDKHRHHEVQKKFYILGYDKKCYRFDEAIDFDFINTVFVKRDQLGRRKKK